MFEGSNSTAVLACVEKLRGDGERFAVAFRVYKRMKIVFLGTPQPSVLTLERLVAMAMTS